MLMFVNVSARDTLQDYLWRYRLVLLFTSSLSDSLIAKQVSLLKSQTDELLDRDLKLIIVPRNSSPTIDGKSGFSSSESFYKRFNVQDDSFTFILVGKDGTEKLRRLGKVVSPQELFQLIDSMPMRKAEMATGN